MASTGFERRPTWSWPAQSESTHPPDQEPRRHVPGSFVDDLDDKPSTSASPLSSSANPHDRSTASSSQSSTSHAPRPPRPRTYGPRTCRICLDVVHPTTHVPDPGSSTPFTTSSPHVTYTSPDPSLGRLLRPCKCRGSARFVHEGCLRSWRHADPSYGARNYYECPTCHFRYRLRRVSWGHALASGAAQLALTAAVFVAAVFALGFVADPIIGLYLDPYDTVTEGFRGGGVRGVVLEGGEGEEVVLPGMGRWVEHFAKGLASLGLLGFVKVFFALTPWQWWNLRASGMLNGGGRTGSTGRDRVANISWVVILLGVGTFLWTVYKGVRAWSRRTLEKASEMVMDVPLEDDEDDFDEQPAPAASEAPQQT